MLTRAETAYIFLQSADFRFDPEMAVKHQIHGSSQADWLPGASNLYNLELKNCESVPDCHGCLWTDMAAWLHPNSKLNEFRILKNRRMYINIINCLNSLNYRPHFHRYFLITAVSFLLWCLCFYCHRAEYSISFAIYKDGCRQIPARLNLQFI